MSYIANLKQYMKRTYTKYKTDILFQEQKLYTLTLKAFSSTNNYKTNNDNNCIVINNDVNNMS